MWFVLDNSVLIITNAPAQVPPFDWKHAELGELRDFLIQEAKLGRFAPSNNLPL